MLRNMFMKSKTPHKVITTSEHGHVRILQVYSDQDGNLETEFGVFPKDQATTYHNELDGGLVYFFNMTHGALVEAEQLKHLQKQVVLSKIFQFDTKTGAKNLKDLIPWIITVIAIIAK